MSLDDDLDRLYRLTPAEFIAERNALAKRAGPQAQDIRALPKPTLPVWAVNQLRWREPALYKSLVESSENLRATHRAVLEGRRGDVRAAGREHEAALDTAIKATLAIAGEDGTPPSDAARQTITTTLRSLPSSDPPGRLRQALAPGGFEMLAALPAGGRVVPAPIGRAAAKPVPQKTAARAPERGRKIDKAALLRARKAAATAERELAKAEQEARREEFEAARAAREVEKAQRRVTRAKEALESAQAELEDAEDAVAAAVKQRDLTRSRATTADRALTTARARHDAAQREVRAADSG
jgi:hypothetical protein